MELIFYCWVNHIIHRIDTVAILIFIYLYVCLLVYYLFLFFINIFYARYFGTRGFFTIVILLLYTLLVFSIAFYIFCARHNCTLTLTYCTLMLYNDFFVFFTIVLNIFTTCGVCIVIVLTIITLLFGIEYMSREAFALDTMQTILIFSASISWFILSNSVCQLLIFWEFAGFFSLVLIDTYYSRIRTTQAMNRTFTISRLSDYFLLVSFAEIVHLFDTDLLSIIFACVHSGYFTAAGTFNIFIGLTAFTVMCVFMCFAAACKCAQFVLFVWLPDAMEAPTPASTLIHSSTLVVMGIFLLIKFMPLLQFSVTVSKLLLVLGALTVLYGSLFSIYTSDLKKSVAYSTISQIGYLFCGCGFFAITEVLLYLTMHALCKALLFVFVGYIIHFFGGYTSLKRMGGVFFQVPMLSTCMCIVCLFLAGLPYTTGFLAKEFLVTHIIGVKSFYGYLVLFCWLISLICTPIYLIRICVIPCFGKPRSNWGTAKQLGLFFKIKLHTYFIELKNAAVLLYNWIDEFQRIQISSKFNYYFLFGLSILVLCLGEFLFFSLSTYFITFNSFVGICGANMYLTSTFSFTISLFNFTFFFNIFIFSIWVTMFIYIFNLLKIYNNIIKYTIFFIFFILVYYLFLFAVIIILLIL